MKNSLSMFRTDPHIEQAGVEFRVTETDPTGKDDFYIQVRRLGNPDYDAELKRTALQTGKRMRHAGINMGEVDKLATKAMARHILVGWRGLVIDDKPVPYSVEKAEELLSTVPDFRRLVEDVANDINLFRQTTMAEQEGN